MKKKLIIIVSTIFSFFVIGFIALLLFYNNSLKAVGNSNENVILIVNNGSTSRQIVDVIYNSGLLKNKYAGYIYLKLHNDFVLQAGTYELNKGMDFEDIINHIARGNVIDNSVSLTFVEGKRLVSYVKLISDKFGYSEEEILETLEDKAYLNSLIDKYWFLTDEILNDNLYYALEGYLYPDTYLFKEDASIKDIISKMLDETGNKLSKYKDELNDLNYSIHEILTMASIVELEGANSADRKGVAGVFYNRLDAGWSLGSDATTYYAAKINFSDRDLYQYEIDNINAYNTRPNAMAGKLPVGPICSPSMESIIAALEPESHDYFYFVADKNKETYFRKTYAEHQDIINYLKNNGLWYVYGE